MTELARKLRVVDYFTLGWGTMVGVGWLVVMDDWLLRGGALGGVLGFAIGGALLLPIGYVYGQLVMAMPDAAGEVAYTAKVFPQAISFATGWMMVLSYFIVCPWEAVAIGKIAGYIFPSLDSLELYRIAGRPVYLPHLVIGLGLIALLTVLNYRGIGLSATFQNWTTFGTLALFVVFVAFGASHGSAANLPPLFTHSGFVSVLLVLQIVPYYMTGYESVAKAAEERSPGFRGLVERKLAAVHPRNQTPSVAVICVGVATAACMFLGDAILVPISEVGSVASAAGWLAACAAYYRMGPAPRERLVAAIGVAVGLGMILMKIVPAIPGHFSGYEWLALAVWGLIGLGLGWRERALAVASAK